MSTRLERAERDYQAGRLHINKYHEIIIAERNQEIKALQRRLKEADTIISALTKELETCRAVTALCCEKD